MPGARTSGQVHHHLRELRSAGLVLAARNHFTVVPERVLPVLVAVAAAAGPGAGPDDRPRRQGVLVNLSVALRDITVGALAGAVLGLLAGLLLVWLTDRIDNPFWVMAVSASVSGPCWPTPPRWSGGTWRAGSEQVSPAGRRRPAAGPRARGR